MVKNQMLTFTQLYFNVCFKNYTYPRFNRHSKWLLANNHPEPEQFGKFSLYLFFFLFSETRLESMSANSIPYKSFSQHADRNTTIFFHFISLNNRRNSRGSPSIQSLIWRSRKKSYIKKCVVLVHWSGYYYIIAMARNKYE